MGGPAPDEEQGVGSHSAESPARSRSRDKAMAKSRWRMRATLVAIVVVVLVVALVGFELVANAGRVHRGVSVAGVELGGVRQAEAKRMLDRELAKRAADPVVLVASETTAAVSAKQVGLSYDTTSLAQAAYDYGRSGELVRDVRDRVRVVFSHEDLTATPVAASGRAEAVVAAFARSVDVAPKDAGVVITGTRVSVTPSASGTEVDRDSTKRLLLAAFAASDHTVDVPLRTAAPTVTDVAATVAADEAKEMLAADVEIAYDSDRWTFAPEAIAKWIAFRRTSDASASAGSSAAGTSPVGSLEPTGDPEHVRLEAFVDPAQVRKLVLPKIGAVGRPAKDATFQVSSGSVSIVPSRDGVGPDVNSLALELSQVLKDPERARTVALRTRRVPPKITTAKAQTMGIKERLSRFTTTYAASNKPRVANIHTLADAIDGTLIEPGGTFSFNGTVGPRTAAKGYQEAPAIVDGKLVPQLGGGICQVGTTLFNTVFEAGLPVAERRNHSFYISHYPKGRDATVSWGGPDFKFRNDTDHWVLLVAAYSDSSLTIALYGTDPGYEVKAETGTWENEKPYATEQTKDPTLPQGARVVEDGGITGRSVTVKRIVSKNGEIVRTDTFRSVYRPKAEVVRVGTKVVPSKGATQTTVPNG